jgi:hypothetical protein
MFFLDFIPIWKITKIFISFIIYVCPSLRPHETTTLPLFYVSILQPSAEKFQDSLQFVKNNMYYTWWHMCIYSTVPLNSSRMRKVSDKCCKKIKTHSMFNFLNNILSFIRQCVKVSQSRVGHRWIYGACAIYAGYLHQQMNIQIKYHLLIFRYKNVCRNATPYYVIRRDCLLFSMEFQSFGKWEFCYRWPTTGSSCMGRDNIRATLHCYKLPVLYKLFWLFFM